MPTSDLPRVKLPSGSDKWVHLLIHSVLVGLWMLYLLRYNNNRFRWRHAVIVLLGSLVFGIIVEILQGCLTVSRTADFFDVIANFGGALVGVLIFQKVKHFFTP